MPAAREAPGTDQVAEVQPTLERVQDSCGGAVPTPGGAGTGRSTRTAEPLGLLASLHVLGVLLRLQRQSPESLQRLV